MNAYVDAVLGIALYDCKFWDARMLRQPHRPSPAIFTISNFMSSSGFSDLACVLERLEQAWLMTVLQTSRYRASLFEQNKLSTWHMFAVILFPPLFQTGSTVHKFPSQNSLKLKFPGLSPSTSSERNCKVYIYIYTYSTIYKYEV